MIAAVFWWSTVLAAVSPADPVPDSSGVITSTSVLTAQGTATDDFLNLYPTIDDSTNDYLMGQQGQLPSTGLRGGIAVTALAFLVAGSALRWVSTAGKRGQLGDG